MFIWLLVNLASLKYFFPLTSDLNLNALSDALTLSTTSCDLSPEETQSKPSEQNVLDDT